MKRVYLWQRLLFLLYSHFLLWDTPRHVQRVSIRMAVRGHTMLGGIVLMKNKFLVFLFLIAFSNETLADFDGNYLYQGYKDYDRNYNGPNVYAFMGYVRGVAAMLILEEKICVDDNFQFSQAFDVVGEYYKSHPKSRSMVPALSVTLALGTEFPCNNKK